MRLAPDRHKSTAKASRAGIGSAAFTLVELMISITILVILMMVVTQVIGIVQRNWVRANSRVSQFREARIAFDTMTRNITQATLNAYWDNESDPLRTDSAGQKISKAKSYVRQSELQFVCGPTPKVLTAAAGGSENYPGHAIFFQAPLGVTRLVAATSAQANTENMVNLLCGRGYFVEWGDDQPYRPPFLNGLNSVPTRFRLRLMEYSPTAEMNRIYASAVRPVTENSKVWFQEALTNTVQDNEQVATRAFTRPIAENILALIVSPQLESRTSTSVIPYSIAPQYYYDSTLVTNPGAGNIGGAQGTQHLLPPLLKVTMIALDQRAGEALSANETVRSEILEAAAGLFQNAAQFQQDLDGVDDESGTLEALLLENKINYRVFTTTIAPRAARWSL